MARSGTFGSSLALSRFGLGSGPNGADAIRDAPDVLSEEIAVGAPIPQGEGLKATPELIIELVNYQQIEKAMREAKTVAPEAAGKAGQPPMPLPMPTTTTMTMAKPMNSETGMEAPRTPQAPKDNTIKETDRLEVDARFNGTIVSPTIGFNERMAMFWMNHFAVSLRKSQLVRMIAGAYEREAIRPYIFGRFSDMLMAVESHPCMLAYLDNQSSVGSNSLANRSGKRGLNENLAREIMELHTLGVGSGYTQADVTAFAKVITGWTFISSPTKGNPEGNPVGVFTFNERGHEPGKETILGKTYSQAGVEQGRSVLLDLARHPATARHIATKLVRHFVADTPPPSLVAKLADTFLRTDGDLAAVSKKLIESDEAWTAPLTKLRSPLIYMSALLRSTDVRLPAGQIGKLMGDMGQDLWQPPGPNGFPDTTAGWASPEGLSARVGVANLVASRTNAALDPRTFVSSRLGDLLSEQTRDAVARAETHTQGISLALLSSEFMRC